MQSTAVSGQLVQAVLLDVDGTLYDQRPLRRVMLLRLLRQLAASPRDGVRTMRVLRAYRHAQETLRTNVCDSCDIDAAQVQLTARWSGVEEHEVRVLVRRWMESEPLLLLARYVRPGLYDFLSAAAHHGIKLGVVSDYPSTDKLRQLDVDHYMDVTLCARDACVGCFKPNPRGLLQAARQLGVQPESTLYVGDRPAIDAAAAKAAGMHCAIVGRRLATPRGADWVALASFDALRRLLFQR